MVHTKLRRVLAVAVLSSAVSLLPAQAASLGSRAPRGVSLFERIGSLQLMAWDFLAGLFEKAGSRWDPSGLQQVSPDDSGY